MTTKDKEKEMRNSGYQLLKAAIDCGLYVKVYYGDAPLKGEIAYKGTQLNKAWEEVTACCDAYVRFLKVVDGKKKGYYGYAYLTNVPSVDAEEVLSDCNVDGFADKWSEATSNGQRDITEEKREELLVGTNQWAEGAAV